MGYRKIPTIYTLTEIPDHEGLIVRMKAVKLGKVRRLMALVENDDDDVLAESLDEMLNLLAEGLVSWNLEDEDGTPVPADMAGIEDQELPFVMAVLAEWLKNMTGVDEELGKDSPSGATFPGQPLTMEAV